NVHLTDHLRTYTRIPGVKHIWERYLISFEKINNLELSDFSELIKLVNKKKQNKENDINN
ncbi:MAG: hypothetical protein ACK5YA_01120, partial [bacterium]